MHDYVIDSEIQSLLNPLTDEERSKLEASIALRGCRESGTVAVLPDGSKMLADGHNRETICADFDIPFLTIEEEFKDRESIIQFVIDNQFGRRNLTEERKAYYRGKEYLNTKKSPVFFEVATIATSESDKKTTAEKLAEKHGVSPKTIRNDADYAEAVDAMPKKDAEIVLSGKSGMTKSEVANGKTLILCDRCQRTGTVKDCANCVEARKAARKPKKAADVETPVAEPEPVEIPCDGNGVPWTGASLIAIKAETQFVEMGRQLSKMAKVIAETESLHLYSYSMQSVVASLKPVRSTLLDALPAYFCPSCDGTLKTVEGREKGKACEVCCRQGWVGKSTYKRSPKGASK